MASRSPDVLVVGAGVSGLTTAVCLAEAGLAVVVLAQQPPASTTSAVAGAIWGPHLVEASDRVDRWSRETLLVLSELAADPETGVRIATGVTATRTAGDGLPPPAAILARAAADGAAPGRSGGPPAGLRRCGPDELPGGFAAGWRYPAPLVDMPVYLRYLLARLESAGGRVRAGTARSLAAAARDARVGAVVNCTGTGAARLAGDPEVTPVRGQTVVTENPGIGEFFIGLPGAGADLLYVFPHASTVVLGGTEGVGDERLEPDPAVAARIVRDACAAQPRLRGARVLAHRVGLRPVRARVRLEAEAPGESRERGTGRGRPPAGPLVVHNYGHGGAGVTLSWGCAREAAALVPARGGPVIPPR